MEIKGIATVQGNTLVFESEIEKLTFWNQLYNFSPNTKVKITINKFDSKKEEEAKRSAAQNRYYHKLLDIIADFTGHESHDELHNDLKIKFLSRPYIHDEKEIILVKSTRDLTTKEFGDYIEKVFKFAVEEYELVLPNASDYYTT